jgi:hypothetical protein
MPEPVPPRPWVKPSDLMLATDVRRLCGIAPSDRHTMLRWRRDRGFPEPIRTFKVGQGRRKQEIGVWDRRDVRAWLKANPPASNEIK